MFYLELPDWELGCYYPYVPVFGPNLESGYTAGSILPKIKAQVPGSVYCDLFREGLIEDPFFEMNSLKCEWVANRWWCYRTSFEAPANKPVGRINLHLLGVDYKAGIYLNKKLIGTCEGMNIPSEFDVTDILSYGESNHLMVVIENAPEEMAQLGYSCDNKVIKARYGYKWDFSTRLVNLGIYKKVYFKETGKLRITDIQIKAVPLTGGKASLETVLDIESVCSCKGTVNILLDGESVCEMQESLSAGHHTLTLKSNLENIKSWNANGMGTQNLYRFSAVLSADGEESDVDNRKIGFKTLEYIQNENAPEDAFPYTVFINGAKMYIKGVNITPLDLMSHYIEREKYKEFLSLLKSAHVNYIRVWGGGYIESEEFYELCDELGFLVWQEFPQSGSGSDSVPSKNPEFLRQLEQAATAAVKEKRNHVCLAAWSGGNELAGNNNILPVTFEDENIAMLHDIVKRCDSGRHMYPSSASGPRFVLDPEKKGNHDVHGNWLYLGTTTHYSFYNNSDCLLHGEFGVPGLNNIDEFPTFMMPENIKVNKSVDNITWKHHGELWGTLDRDENVFGKIDALEDYELASQFIQGEGLRYILEANRRRAFQNSGSIIWQANEPWPNASCTNIITYGMQPKLAYYMVQKAFDIVNPCIKYNKLTWDIGETFECEYYVVTDIVEDNAVCKMEVFDGAGKSVLNKQWDTVIKKGTAVKIENISMPIKERGHLTIVMSAEVEGCVYENTVLILIKDNGICDIGAVRGYISEYYSEWYHK